MNHLNKRMRPEPNDLPLSFAHESATAGSANCRPAEDSIPATNFLRQDGSLPSFAYLSSDLLTLFGRYPLPIDANDKTATSTLIVSLNKW
ncbi:hypothetical protein OUZ56_021922 [Daphnia magna]|uniref:Uncharacterized protein n=1 Tax=Daphnia magna TaxID=35525 RepID=A0ABR0AUU7_9CRUS|nr:hypothetical protein OUZ56_021922 [Daphnia magna]